MWMLECAILHNAAKTAEPVHTAYVHLNKEKFTNMNLH